VSRLFDGLLALHGLVLYAIVGALVFAEDAFLVGLVVPGETGAVLGGAAASRGNADLAAMAGVIAVAAIAGDAVGYGIGARFGPRVRGLRLVRTRQQRFDRAQDFLRRRGGPAVFLGRFVAFLRTVVPFLAGSSRMSYGQFTAYNVAGGLIWGIACAVLGFLAGSSYQVVVRILGPVTAAVTAVLVGIALLVWWVRRRHLRRTS
jgi:membrane protein DedA with SNARE-associated domain